jgi:hypothetical protein
VSDTAEQNGQADARGDWPTSIPIPIRAMIQTFPDLDRYVFIATF